MLPIKAIDAVQPLYGLTALILLLVYAATMRTEILGPVAVVLAGRLGLELVFAAWAMGRYRRWSGQQREAASRVWRR